MAKKQGVGENGGNSSTILNMLRQDHKDVKTIFEKFEKTENSRDREKYIGAAIAALEVHAALEEKLIYPAFRPQIGEEDLMDEALEEHHVMHVLIKELKGKAGERGRRHAKFVVLAENVRHHIKEEEQEMFPHMKNADLDWAGLTQKTLNTRAQLEK